LPSRALTGNPPARPGNSKGETCRRPKGRRKWSLTYPTQQPARKSAERIKIFLLPFAEGPGQDDDQDGHLGQEESAFPLRVVRTGFYNGPGGSRPQGIRSGQERADMEHLLILILELILWLDRRSQKPLRKAIPNLNRLLLDPAKTLAAEPISIGPARRYFS